MSSSIGENIRLTIFGESHGKAVGMTLEGIPAGLKREMGALQRGRRTSRNFSAASRTVP